MNEPIAIPPRAAAQVQPMVDELNNINAHLRTAVEAIAAALDVPQGYRFDVQRMAFVPPAAAEETNQEESAQ